MPVRKERVRPWFGPVGVEPGVDDRGVARDGVDEDVVELGSRPVTGGFLAAIVDMVEQAIGGCGIDVFRAPAWREEGNKDKRG